MPTQPPINLTDALKDDYAKAFNEWMRLFTDDPEEFQHQWQTIGDYLTDVANGEEPTYGQSCAVFFDQLLDKVRKC